MLARSRRSRAPSSVRRSCRRRCRSAPPKQSWNCHRLCAWLAVTRPSPSSRLPVSTTMRVPKRSDSAPQRNAGNAHAEEIQRRRRRHAGARPAHRFRDRLQEHRERQHGAEADAGHQRARADDDPAIVEARAALLMRFLVARSCCCWCRAWGDGGASVRPGEASPRDRTGPCIRTAVDGAVSRREAADSCRKRARQEFRPLPSL